MQQFFKIVYQQYIVNNFDKLFSFCPCGNQIYYYICTRNHKTKNTMKKTNVSIQTKLRLVNEINAWEQKAIGDSFTWAELKQISKEIESRLEYFNEGEKEIYFNGRYKEIDYHTL